MFRFSNELQIMFAILDGNRTNIEQISLKNERIL